MLAQLTTLRMPDDTTEPERKLFDLLCDHLHNQSDLLDRDISQAIEEEFGFYERGPTDDRKAWLIQVCVRNTAVLFRQELLDLARLRFPWATSVELKMYLEKEEEPVQWVDLKLSPLPLLP